MKSLNKIKLPNATRSTNKTYKAKEVLQILKPNKFKEEKLLI
ncbi:hypothetical protein [Lebetimonas sp. JH292]|nr:hypothetical protein [Lebetimonas sp. JH292]